MAAESDLQRIYDEHAQALFGFLLNLTRDESDTRDLLQDVFVRIARQPDLLRRARNPRAYLLHLAHNAAIDLIRRRAARVKYQDQAAGELSSAFAATGNPDEQSFRSALSEAVGDLPPEQRAVVHLKLWEGMTFDAIAGVLGISLNTAASRYRYGLDKLRERLRPLYEEIR
jgi:RNA polymerase sigma-70 factor (ECF subfamily)